MDTINKMISLPEHRGARLLENLNLIATSQRSIATKEWHKIIGELRSMSVTIRGCTGLFSVLQEVFCHENKSRPSSLTHPSWFSGQFLVAGYRFVFVTNTNCRIDSGLWTSYQRCVWCCGFGNGWCALCAYRNYGNPTAMAVTISGLDPSGLVFLC